MSVTTGLNDLVAETTPSTTSGNGHHEPTTAFRPAPRTADDTLVVVPAGWLGDIVGSLAGVAGRAIGGAFGNEKLGETIGDAAGPIIKHFSPFQVLPPAVTPSSAGPDQQPGVEEALVVVPAGFLSGLLGGVGGKLLGGVIGGAFGNKELGSSIGGGIGGALGSAFGPFSVAPPTLSPASAGSQPAAEEGMLILPAGFVANLLGGVARTLGGSSGNRTVSQIADIAGSVIESIVPWQALPTELSPASAGPESAPVEDLVVVPASLLAGLSTIYGRMITNCFAQIKPIAGSTTGQTDKVLPFSAVPSTLLHPANDAPGSAEEAIFVPAGLIGGLLTSFGGALGGRVGKEFGHEKIGRAVGEVVGELGKFLPFQVVPD